MNYIVFKGIVFYWRTLYIDRVVKKALNINGQEAAHVLRDGR